MVQCQYASSYRELLDECCLTVGHVMLRIASPDTSKTALNIGRHDGAIVNLAISVRFSVRGLHDTVLESFLDATAGLGRNAGA